MRFHPLFLAPLSAVVLASCGSATVSYRLTFDTQDIAIEEEMTKAALRVISRRLDRLETAIGEQNIVKDADGVTVELVIPDRAAAETLTAELTQPFDLQIMTQTDAPNPDVTVEGLGGFAATGVTHDDIVRVSSVKSEDGAGAVVLIYFTDEGHAKLGEAFKASVGKTIGIFVRGALVSALTVTDPAAQNPLVISGVPDLELANIFADDVNVGAHVTVTPL